MKDNDRINTDMNETLQNTDASSEMFLLNIHTISQSNKSSKPNETNTSVYNFHFNGDYCYMNRFIVFVIKNHNSIHYTKKRNKISTKTYLR